MNLFRLIDEFGQAYRRGRPLPVSAEPFITELLPLTLDTSGAYAAGEVLADVLTIQLPDNRPTVLHEIYVLDEDDQGQAFDVLITDALIPSLAAKNATWDATDVNMRKRTSRFASITAGDYRDLGGNRVADVSGLARFVTPDLNGRLYVYTISQGTGTYTVNGLRLSFSFLR